MNLIFYPVRMDQGLTAEVAGDVLTLNGEALDFGPLPKGAILPRAAIQSDWIAGDVLRDEDGALTVPLILPFGHDAPEATRFAAPMTVGDGVVALPVFDAAHMQEAADVKH